jgi:hypothetical protein
MVSMRSIVSIHIVLAFVLSPAIVGASGKPTPAETRAIAAEAYTYGFPLVDNYRIMYDYWVDEGAREYKGPINTIQNSATVYGPQDKAIQTPNSDTPYSYAWLDLRTEPMVLTLPPIEKARYYSVQLIDTYTHNFDYLGTRTSGNDGGSFLIAGPGWKGEAPNGIKRVLRADTQFVFALYRTQLLNPADIDNVRKIQAGYKAQPLSAFLGQPAPKSAPAIDYVKPLTPDQQKSSLDVFRILNFVLTFCPPLPDEQKLLARFARIGVAAGETFAPESLSPEMKQALEDGIADAWADFAGLQKQADAGKVTSGDLFGTRQYLHNNYLYRLAGAVLGIYGNSKEEAMYPTYFVDADGKPLDASKSSYTLHLAKDQMPPADAFWSLTMYRLPERLLVANTLNRYLINSPMLPELKRDADGGITLYVRSTSPGKDKESNWLPAPEGPFFAVMRLYMPGKAALDGTWKNPPMQRTQ